MYNQNQDTYVFLGPSLPIDEAKAILPDAIYCVPVSCGDVMRILLNRPQRIAIIDGFFEHHAAVWHKEILAALEQDIAVFGASSMGALRAAELYPFGMIGVGKIFELYRSGVIEDDDEVVLLHGPREHGYLSLSEPFINIRITLAEAHKQLVISTHEFSQLIELGKTIFYKERTLDTIIHAAIENKIIGLSASNNLMQWLKKFGLIDQKREDALELLRKLKSDIEASTKKKRNPIKAEKSIFYRALKHKILCEPIATQQSMSVIKHNRVQLRRLSYLLPLVYAADLDDVVAESKWWDVKKLLERWPMVTHEILSCVKNIFLKSGILLNPLSQNINQDENLLNWLRLVGKYPTYREILLSNNKAQQEKLQQTSEAYSNEWRLELDVAKLWHVLWGHLKQSHLLPSKTTVTRYTEKFYQQLKIKSMPDLQIWIEKNDLTTKKFYKFMQYASAFEYIVNRSNFDPLGIEFPDDTICWYSVSTAIASAICLS